MTCGAHPSFPSQRDGPTEPSQAGAVLFPLPPFPPLAHHHIVRSKPNSSMPRGRAPAVLLPVLVLVAAAVAARAAATEEALPVEPMEMYFSAAELARIAGYGEEPVSSVSVSGQVACELCLPPGDVLSLELPGAQVALICQTEGHNQGANSAFATTDEYGNFTIDLPSQLHATPNLEKACTVKVLQLPLDSCRISQHPGSTYSLKLSSEDDGVRTYTTGLIRLQHSDAPSDKCVNVQNRSDRR